MFVLLLSSGSKLLTKWQGPFLLTRRVGNVDNDVVQSDRRTHNIIVLLKGWREAEPVSLVTMVTEGYELEPEVPKSSNSTLLLCDDHLTLSHGADVTRLQQCYADVFSPLPGHTDLICHHIEACSLPYCLPEHKRKVVQEELAAMQKMGVIQESNSAWCSPIVLVVKKNGTVRFCVDYRNWMMF